MTKVALIARPSSHVYKIAGNTSASSGNTSHTPLDTRVADAAGGPLPARQRTIHNKGATQVQSVTIGIGVTLLCICALIIWAPKDGIDDAFAEADDFKKRQRELDRVLKGGAK